MVSEKLLLDAASAAAAVFESPRLSTLSVRGVDRKSWLNGLVTSDLQHLTPDQGSYGLLLVKVGRIVSDMWFLDAQDSLLVGVQQDRRAVVQEHLERFLMMEDAAQEDVSAEHVWFHAHGPQAFDVARAMSSRLGGVSSRLDLTGLGGAAFCCPATRAPLVRDKLLEFDGVLWGDDDDWERLRVLRHLPRFGADFSEKSYPQEASLEKLAVSFSKGCYLGQEVVCRLEMRGHVTKKLVPLRIDRSADSAGTQVMPRVGAPVRSPDGKSIGTITSVTQREGAALALAMLHHEFTGLGTEVDVDGRSGRVMEGLNHVST